MDDPIAVSFFIRKKRVLRQESRTTFYEKQLFNFAVVEIVEHWLIRPGPEERSEDIAHREMKETLHQGPTISTMFEMPFFHIQSADPPWVEVSI